MWPNLSGGECLDLLGHFQGGLDPARRAELIDRFELDPTRRARTYSKGNRQKVALVAALAADVDLYLLDEPTSGLDPLMEARFQATVAEITAAGRTVLLSSHILDEVEALCDRVTIIRAGRTVSTGTLADLRAHTVTTVAATTAAAVPGLAGLPGVAGVRVDPVPGGVHTELTASAEALPDAVAAVAAARPSSLTVRPPSLDELFLQQYEEL